MPLTTVKYRVQPMKQTGLDVHLSFLAKKFSRWFFREATGGFFQRPLAPNGILCHSLLRARRVHIAPVTLPPVIIILRPLVFVLVLLLMAAPLLAATKVAMKAKAGSQFRQVKKVVRGVPTSDGMGVKLTRSIGSEVMPDLDPFLLLDEFNSHNVRFLPFCFAWSPI